MAFEKKILQDLWQGFISNSRYLNQIVSGVMQLPAATTFIFTVALTALVSVASPASAQDGCDLDSLDANYDGYLDVTELRSAFSRDAYYDGWDADGDGIVTEQEWNTVADEYLGVYDVGDFSSWDITEDGILTSDELYNATLKLVDKDEDGMIEETEWHEFTEWDLFAVEEMIYSAETNPLICKQN